MHQTKTESLYSGIGDAEGKDKRVVFVCTSGILRSATAARIYAKKYNTRCAGSKPSVSLILLSHLLLKWADEIVFVHPYNFDLANMNLDLNDYMHKIKILNIPDDYDHMQPELILEFVNQYEPLK